MTTVLKPPALKPGDTIGVMAPSSYVGREDIERAVKIVEDKGFKVFVHPQTYERHNQSAGLPLQKALALQGLWQRADIKAIWCAGGGNRALHFVDSVNFETMKRNPKILIGFSDITVILNSLYAKAGIPSVHGPVFKRLDKFQEWDLLLHLLAGENIEYKMPKAKILHDGKAEGRLIGGNLSLFQYLPQTLPGEFWKDGILFLEDCSEELSRLDRMLLHLKRIGVLKNIAGLVCGQFSDLKESGRPYGFTLEEIIREHTEGLDIPILMNAPFGHAAELQPFPVGIKAMLDTKTPSIALSEPFSAA